MTLYSVKDWNAKYENNRTRDLKKMEWLPLRVRHDGDGYTHLLSQPEGAAMFGCWVAVLQVAAKCEPRGRLIRDTGEPHTALSISRMSHMPAGLVGRTLPVLVHIRWLDAVPYEVPVDTPVEIPHEGAVSVLPFRSIPDPGKGDARGEGSGDVYPQLKGEIGAHFKRPESQRWDYEEERLLFGVCKSPTAVHDWHTILSYRSKVKEFQCRSLIALLQNWSRELDKARNYEPPAQLDRKGNPIKTTVSLMPKMSRLEKEDGL